MLAYSHMRYCTPGVGLQQDISTAGLQSQGYLHAEALGCQCKGYLGRSPLLCRSTTVNGTTALLLFGIAMVYGSAGPHLMQGVGWLCGSTWFTARYTLHVQVPFDS